MGCMLSFLSLLSPYWYVQWACTAHVTHSKYFMSAEVSTDYVPVHTLFENLRLMYTFSVETVHVNMPGDKE